MRQKKYFEAYLDDFDKIIVYMSRNSYEGQSNKFWLKDKHGNIVELPIQSIEYTQLNYVRYTLRLYSQIQFGEEYYVQHQYARETILEYAYVVKQKRFDDMFAYNGNDLGPTYSKTHTDFALWAPCASQVKIEITKDDKITTLDMIRTDKGVYRLRVTKDLENAEYVYLVRINGEWKESIDPYAKGSNANAKKSIVIDPSRIKMRYYKIPEMKSYTDAIIYETSIRDFTSQTGIGVENPAKYLGFVEENEITKKKETGFSYLKSLGVTHVQFMPVLDFGSVDENHPHMHYNWGYDPVQYFVLEGSYSIEVSNPYSRIMEFIRVVEECHKAGMRVILDVVYNHVYDLEKFSLQTITPHYFFQMNEQGEYSNGTYCGNDFDSTTKMGRKFIVDSCKYLVNTFHVDGFRFDLMGILDKDTMNEIYQECYRLNESIMIYGEGWDMPSLLAPHMRASMPNTYEMPHIAHFSDRFRDVVKGRTSQHEVNVKGYLSGAAYLIQVMKNCMSASVTNEGERALFPNPVNVVNYVECHDNMTCWDKLKECCKEDTNELRIKRQCLIIGATLLAQGIPFIHSGQEFARTKFGKGNTYCDHDGINWLDYERKDRYSKIVEFTKSMIQLRKKFDCFRYSTKEEVEKYVSYETIKDTVLIYKMKDETNDVMVIMNPTSEKFDYTLPYEYDLLFYHVDVENEVHRHLIIEGYSFIVLSKHKQEI